MTAIKRQIAQQAKDALKKPSPTPDTVDDEVLDFMLVVCGAVAVITLALCITLYAIHLTGAS